MEDKRLTNKNLDEYNPEIDFCSDCKYYGEPNGCNRPDGTCTNYDRFLETYNCLNEFKDKIENRTLIELFCRVGDTIYFVHKLDGENIYLDEGKVVSFSIDETDLWLYAKYNSGLTYWHKALELGNRLFLIKEQAEAKLKELQNKR